jgi:hypothetical protein
MKGVLSILFIFMFAFSIFGNNKIDSKGSKDDNTLIIPSNGEADSINISQIVAAQIKQAHKKMLSEQSKSSAAETQTVKYNTTETNTHSFITLPAVFNSLSTTITKVSILASASFIAAFIVIVRRKKNNKIFRSKKALKDNIKLLREERIFVKRNSKMSDVRNKLKNNPSLYGQSKEAFSQRAKELNISQGEILLAAKIKAHELSKTWLTKQ